MALNLGDRVIVERADFQQVLDTLAKQAYRVVGPTVRSDSIVYGDLKSVADLPQGWTDEQAPGHYRLRRREDEALFGYVVGPHAWKEFLSPPVLQLWQAKQDASGFRVVQTQQPPAQKLALIGVRACELNAIAIQDKVFLQGPFVDEVYRSRREGLFILAVNCGLARATCFCTSMGTGPQVTAGFDLALTEILDEARHYFLVEVGSEPGRAVMQEVPHREATLDEIDVARQIVEATTAQVPEKLNTEGLKEILYASYDNPRWLDVAERCLACGNCTSVCPTCFCVTLEETSDLTGEYAGRMRKWDSCFGIDFSYIHGGSVRTSVKSRYRQWLTHKLATWIDQFGSSGCVGCGRCITWCPVGIDITEEATAIRESALAAAAKS